MSPACRKPGFPAKITALMVDSGPGSGYLPATVKSALSPDRLAGALFDCLDPVRMCIRRNLRIRKMKIKNSLKSLKARHRENRLVRRKGRVYIINKLNPRFKARQG